MDTPTVNIAGAEVPDALLVPARWRQGRTSTDRARSIARLASPILGVPRDGLVHMRMQKPIDLPPGKADARPDGTPGEMIYCTREIEETLFFPITHPLRGKERYAWVKNGECWWGFHIPEVKENTWSMRGNIAVPALTARAANGSA